jgi:UDP-GlcNAc:undecaprenyl-phosphate GlcNAc-1-phosphate transferase
MLRLGYTTLQTTFILGGINILLIIMVLFLHRLGNLTLMLLIFASSLLFNWAITFFMRSKERGKRILRNLFI